MFRTLRLIATAVLFLAPFATLNAQIAVKHPVGGLHGFLTIKSQSGNKIGWGEFDEAAQGDTCTIHLTYHFVDGSVDEQTTVFTQRDNFKLVSDHRVQRGKFFPHPMDLAVDGNGQATLKITDTHGNVKTETTHIDTPSDASGGLISYSLINAVLTNIAPDASPFKMAMVVPMLGKPHAVRLDVSPAGKANFSIVGTTQHASVFRLKVEIGGIAGAIAPVVGKQPADSLLSVMEGDAPTIVRIVGPLGEDTPVVSIELAGTTWARGTAETAEPKKK